MLANFDIRIYNMSIYYWSCVQYWQGLKQCHTSNRNIGQEVNVTNIALLKVTRISLLLFNVSDTVIYAFVHSFFCILPLLLPYL